MDLLRNWKTGAVVGLFYGIAALFFHPSFESRNFLLIGPLFVISIPFYFLDSIFTKIPNFEYFFLPVAGIILGALLWKGIIVFCRKLPNYNRLNKGLIIGIIFALCAIFLVLLNPSIGIMFFGPIALLSITISEQFFGGFGMNIQFFLLFLISGFLLGSMISYLICLGKSE